MLTHRQGWLVGAIALGVMIAVLWANRDGMVAVPSAPPPSPAAAEFARGPASVADAAASVPERERAQAGLAEEVDGTPLALHVLVLLPDGGPAAGAEVWYWPPRSPAQRERDTAAREQARDTEVALRASGRVAIADVRGKAVIHTETAGRLGARLGRLYAEVDLPLLESLPEELVLRLAEDVTLRVLAVDEEGQPREGIEIEAEVQHRSRRLGSVVETRAVGCTDVHGLVVLPHAQVSFATSRPEFLSWQMRVGCVQQAMGVGVCEVTAADFTRPEPIRLVVRTGGTIVARVVDADGALWWQFGSTFLVGPDAPNRVLPAQWSTSPKQYTFRQLPLHQQWQLHSGAFSMPVVGPKRSNEVVEAVLQVPVRQWELVGRLRRSDGVGLAEATVALLGADPVPELTTTCGPDGELRLWWSLPAEVGDLAGVELEVGHELLAGKVRLPLGATLRSGRTELGDLVVPVPADEVLLASVELRCEGKGLSAGEAHLLARGGGDESRVPVVARRLGPVLSLYGRPRPVQMDLQVSHPDCLSSPRTAIEVGEHRIVALQRAASLEVRIDAPTSPQQLVWAELGPADGRERWVESGGATFTWPQRQPGRYTLRVGVKDRVLYEAVSIVLEPGRNRWPVDGAPIDLRGAPGAIRLDVRSADRNEAIVDFHSYVVPAGASWGEGDELPDAESLGDWFVPHREPKDVLITARGFVPVRLANPSADMLVSLQRCTRLHVGGAALGRGVTVRVTIVRDGVVDALLRACDGAGQHEAFEESDLEEPIELLFAPGTIVEVVLERDGVAGAAQRVVVGAVSPQDVVVR